MVRMYPPKGKSFVDVMENSVATMENRGWTKAAPKKAPTVRAANKEDLKDG